jgi:hypothetical protein
MKTFNPRTLAVLPLVAAMVLMTGCATIDNATQKMGHAVGIKNDNTSAAVSGGAIGCGAGALIGHFLGKSALAGCAVGGATGAITAVEIHKHQVAAARKLATEAKAAGATADVKTETVQIKDSSGKSQSVEKLDSMTIRFEASDVRAHGSASAQLLAKTARLADASSEPVTINIRGPKTERTWMNAQVTGALKSATTATVTQAYDAVPELVLTPVPNVSK